MNQLDPVAIDTALDACLRCDQYRLRRERDRLRSERQRGRDVTAAEANLARRIAASAAARAARAASLPAITYPPELPVAAQREDIRRAIERHPVVIVCGETGSGKTTQLPKICLEAGRGIAGAIGHTQPRRIAARTVAARIAEELGTPLGQLVGYKLRFQDRTRPEGLIKLMTDGILLAETQRDRFLDAYDTLIVDEAHERSLNIDFLLGYLKWLLPRRPDLKLVITSATIDPERFSRHFGDAPIVNVSGRSYPVEIRYRSVALDEEDDETAADEQAAILAAVDELWREQAGDILVFLSGEREIRETAESLRKHHPQGCEVLPLYSRLSQDEQQRVFRPSGQRRIVLATNVAETSLTVPGIRAVIDTGVARFSRYSHRSRLQRLPIEKISQASANQRAGRCGRVGPGIAIRLYSEQDFLARPEFTEPEIQRTNLAAVILQMHALKLGEVEAFPFVEPPDARYVRDGQRTLRELGALSDQGQLTETGRRLAKLPLDPRLGRILLAGATEHCLEEVAIIAAALSVPDPRNRPADQQTQADQKHAPLRDERSDFLSLLKLWRVWAEQRGQLSRAKLRSWCKENFLSYLRLTEWQDVYGQVMEVVKGEFALQPNAQPAQYDAIHRALLAGLLSQVAQRREQGEYLGANGTKLFIHPGSGQFKARPAWIVSAEQVQTTRVYARTVARVDPAWVEQAGAHLVRRQHYDPHWERRAARAAIYERVTLFGLTLSSGRRVPYERIDPRAARELFIRHALVQMEYDSRAPFLAHNRKLLEDTEYLQQKGRRVDLLADEGRLYDFFDARVPDGISTGAAFERWRREAEAKEPKLLWLTARDIAASDATLEAERFPDHLAAGPLAVQLRYCFDPGHEDDGVSALVPLHVLNQLPEEPFGWLVPGLLEEKVTALLRSLPKNLRVHFVPVPETVARVLPRLEPGRGSLHAQFAAALSQTGGVPVAPDAFREDSLPPHLRMNFLLLDDAGKVIARSRSLAVLRRSHAGASEQNYARQSRLTSGARSWVFGDMPERQELGAPGRRQLGYPALVDEGDSVGLRAFATTVEAGINHERGCARLIRLVLARELKSLRRDLAVNVQAELVYRGLTAHPVLSGFAAGRDLRDDLLDRIVMTVFLDDRAPLRSAAAFEARVESLRGSIGLPAQEISRLVQALLERLGRIQVTLTKAPMTAAAAVADIRAQLAWLVPAGFLILTPWRRLQELPRYLQAIEQRLDKLGRDAPRDPRLVAEIAPLEARWRERVKAERGLRAVGEDEFRWLLEEFRVSLFAQQLKTRVPVSARRLEQAWLERERQPLV
ncbi:MAG: ATP-dependent RNA helicase HrpA [Sinobacteraceae bacterium]|nr:ATP-dependent RNA helicase HrpA [Nevskiaceae bacterium]MCP5470662.1 ATP-dependent RNA helicase HrpA [Nevskiaceae bacterium]